MIKSFSVQVMSKNAYELAKQIAGSSGVMKDLYDDKTPEGISHYENIEELLNAIRFCDHPRDLKTAEIQPGKDAADSHTG